jgi:hypothetical protein
MSPLRRGGSENDVEDFLDDTGKRCCSNRCVMRSDISDVPRRLQSYKAKEIEGENEEDCPTASTYWFAGHIEGGISKSNKLTAIVLHVKRNE